MSFNDAYAKQVMEQAIAAATPTLQQNLNSAQQQLGSAQQGFNQAAQTTANAVNNVASFANKTEDLSNVAGQNLGAWNAAAQNFLNNNMPLASQVQQQPTVQPQQSVVQPQQSVVQSNQPQQQAASAFAPAAPAFAQLTTGLNANGNNAALFNAASGAIANQVSPSAFAPLQANHVARLLAKLASDSQHQISDEEADALLAEWQSHDDATQGNPSSGFGKAINDAADAVKRKLDPAVPAAANDAADAETILAANRMLSASVRLNEAANTLSEGASKLIDHAGSATTVAGAKLSRFNNNLKNKSYLLGQDAKQLLGGSSSDGDDHVTRRLDAGSGSVLPSLLIVFAIAATIAAIVFGILWRRERRRNQKKAKKERISQL